jgi:hypothetical protein
MYKINIILTFVVHIIIGLSSVFSVNYHVHPNGHDANNGISFQTAFKTIQTATNRVKAGDSVIIKGAVHLVKK